jgi:predicted nucleic-acid-binding protein
MKPRPEAGPGWIVKITADTNLLVRAVVEDDERQAKLAKDALEGAQTVALTIPALCEFVWVLTNLYKVPRAGIAAALRRLVAAENVVVDRRAVEAGLAMLDAGGDFADGVIAFDGNWLGSEEFVSFDRRAVALLAAHGESARLLA